MWVQILGTMVGAFLGWAAAVTVLFYFLGFPPLGEVIDVFLLMISILTQDVPS